MSDLAATSCGGGCNSCDGGSSCSCIIWILLILSCCGGNGFGFGNSCGNGCGDDSSCIIWILLILCCCGGNGFGGCGSSCC